MLNIQKLVPNCACIAFGAGKALFSGFLAGIDADE